MSLQWLVIAWDGHGRREANVRPPSFLVSQSVGEFVWGPLGTNCCGSRWHEEGGRLEAVRCSTPSFVRPTSPFGDCGNAGCHPLHVVVVIIVILINDAQSCVALTTSFSTSHFRSQICMSFKE